MSEADFEFVEWCGRTCRQIRKDLNAYTMVAFCEFYDWLKPLRNSPKNVKIGKWTVVVGQGVYLSGFMTLEGRAKFFAEHAEKIAEHIDGDRRDDFIRLCKLGGKLLDNDIKEEVEVCRYVDFPVQTAYGWRLVKKMVDKIIYDDMIGLRVVVEKDNLHFDGDLIWVFILKELVQEVSGILGSVSERARHVHNNNKEVFEEANKIVAPWKAAAVV